MGTGGEQSKHGVWHAELEGAIAQARALDLEVVGLHVHIGSGVDVERLAPVRDAMQRFAGLVGSTLAWVSAGGGLRWYAAPRYYVEAEARWENAADWAGVTSAVGMGVHLGR